MDFKFDLIDRNEVRNTIQGLEIVRPVYVKNLEVAAGTSDPAVLLKIISDPQCPQLGTAHPDSSQGETFLEEHRLRTVDTQFRRSAWLDLVYRGTPVTLAPGGSIGYVIEQSTQQVQVQTWATDGGTALTVWYKIGEDASTTTFPVGGVLKGVHANKIQCYDVIRAVGTATKAEWDVVKANIRATRGKIHSDDWGNATRGKYLFLGPSVRYTSRGRMVNIQLDFLGDDKGHFPLLAYFNEHGEHPADSAAESDIRSGGPPDVNTYKGRNGLTLASIYPETTFGDKFSFTPDD